MITQQATRANFNENRETSSSQDEAYTDGSMIDMWMGEAAAPTTILRMLRQPAATRLQDSSRMTGPTLLRRLKPSLWYWTFIGTDPMWHDIFVYCDLTSCLQAIDGEDNENPIILYIMNFLCV